MGDPEGDGVALQLLDTLLLVVAVSDTLALAEGSDDAPSTQWRGTTCNGTREVNPLRHLPLPSHTHHDTFPVHSDALLHDCPRSEHILADMVEVADTAIHSLMEVLLGGETGVASGHFEQLTTSPPGL